MTRRHAVLLSALVVTMSACLVPPIPPSSSAPIASAAPAAMETPAPPATDHSHLLTADAIRNVVMSNLAGLRACYEKQAQKNPHLKGDIRVGWGVAAEGHVTDAKILSSTMESPAVEKCVVKRVTEWRFPATSTSSNVDWPFKFGLAGP